MGEQININNMMKSGDNLAAVTTENERYLGEVVGGVEPEGVTPGMAGAARELEGSPISNEQALRLGVQARQEEFRETWSRVTVADVMNERLQVEQKILELLQEFQRTTGVGVVRIEVTSFPTDHDDSTGEEAPIPLTENVKLIMGLPGTGTLYW